MSFQFNQPSGGSGFFKPADANGHLVLILNVHGIETRFDQMKGGDAPIATVDLVDLDAPGQELRERCFVTHAGILNKLSVGAHMVLGRIGQVPTKSGMQAWVLQPFDEAGQDAARAGQWLDAQAGNRVSQPAAPAAPAPQAPPVPVAQVQQQPPAPAAAAPAAPQASAAVNPNSPEVQALLAQLQGQQPQ